MAGAPNSTNGPTTPQRSQRPNLVPIIVVVLAIVAAVVIFTLTRAQPNYQEEQVPGPDPVETTT